MANILVTGAGFSRNWGGWLADEAFEYLLGVDGLHPRVRRMLFLVAARKRKSRSIRYWRGTMIGPAETEQEDYPKMTGIHL
jgi:hypothetical protein